MEAKNHAEALVHQTEKQLEEHGDKVSGDVKGEIEKAVSELKEARETDNLADIQAKHQALMSAAMKLGEASMPASRRQPPMLTQQPMPPRMATMWSMPTSKKSTTTRNNPSDNGKEKPAGSLRRASSLRFRQSGPQALPAYLSVARISWSRMPGSE